ncbi:unnamed protein product [Larinioides sclopetarius]|uniref:TGF-beta family profile domain-containing protein n=1 Tax=Larinioides sclopetarius TaxID=280406 RepID=A0AAV2BSG8_9ARAC
MLVSWSALVAILVSVTAAWLEPEAQQEVVSFQRRVLASLGMKRLPDMRQVNTTQDELQRMTRKYLRNVRRSEQELLTYHHTDCERDSYVEFHPEIEYDSRVLWARLRFPNSSTSDVSDVLRKWRRDGEELLLTLPCLRCCGARLEILVRESTSGARSKRSACGRECCRRPLRIRFKDIGWDWIVQPAEFEAFYCKGRCRDSTDDFASTHALMQSILSFKGRKVSRPCCAPRKLRPLNLLHYNDKQPPELVVTRQKGMIVKECACT